MTMPSFWSLLHTPSVELLGWTLLHFVWQGALMAAVLSGALYLLRTHSPRVRYVVSCVALLGLLVLPIGTGVILSGNVGPSAPVTSTSTVVVDDVAMSAEASRATEPAVASASSWRAWMATQVRPVLPWIVLAWGLGVLGFALRLGGGAWRVRRVRRSSRAAPSEWQDRLRSLADRMGVSAPVGLRQSARVDGPVLAGWWRPVILVPAGFLSGLPPAQALTALAERAVEGTATTAWAPAATDGSLIDRIQRLVVPPEAPSTAGRRLSIVAAALLMVIVPVGLAACASQQSSTSETSSGTAVSVGEETPPSQGREHRESTIVSVRDDSSRRVITLRAPETVDIDSLDDGGYVLQYERGDADTLRIPHPEAFMSLDIFGEERRSVSDSVRLARHFPMRLGSDSLGRVIVGDVNPDSLKRLIQTRFSADSLKRVLRERFGLDSLEHRALRVRYQADSLAQRFADRFSDEWAERWRGMPDSAFVFRFDGVGPGEFDREDFEFDLDVDSLLRRHEEHADSLRRHFEQMHERMEREVPEHLREEARRLREQAERLEERAEEMDDRREESENGSSG